MCASVRVCMCASVHVCICASNISILVVTRFGPFCPFLLSLARTSNCPAGQLATVPGKLGWMLKVSRIDFGSDLCCSSKLHLRSLTRIVVQAVASKHWHTGRLYSRDCCVHWDIRFQSQLDTALTPRIRCVQSLSHRWGWSHASGCL